MYKIKIFVFLFLALTIGSLSGNVLANTNHIENINYTRPVDQCTNPTEFRAISTVALGLQYNTTVMKVPKNTCVKITFVNLQVIAHDFMINADTNSNHSFGGAYIYLASDTAGVNGGNYLSQNVLTPNTNITYRFYCNMTGHSASMSGDFIVGSGSPASALSPGFEFIAVFSSLVTFVTIIRIRKRKN